MILQRFYTVFSHSQEQQLNDETLGQTPCDVQKTYMHCRVPQGTHVLTHFLPYSVLLCSVKEMNRCFLPAGDSCGFVMNEAIHSLWEPEFTASYSQLV